MAPEPSTDDRYFSLPQLSVYASLSVRTLRKYLTHAVYPLPSFRIGGRVLVRRSEYDAWALRFRVQPTSAVEAIVNDVMRGL
jgi:predicted DNA-binding transcriptional regulator AlpA